MQIHNNKKPLVSIVVTPKNGEKLISDTITSIIENGYQNIEIVCVDDGCKDKTLSIIKNFNDDRIKIYTGENKGYVQAMNLGKSLSKGKYLVNCDQDDLIYQGRIEKQVYFLEENSYYGAICGSLGFIDQAGKVISEVDNNIVAVDLTNELITGRNSKHHSSYMIRE